MKVFKLTGAGNHFLLVDLRSGKSKRDYSHYVLQHLPRAKRKTAAKTAGKKSRSQNGKTQIKNEKSWRKFFAKELCNPYQSVGADGLLFLENSSTADLKWDFYNADGSGAAMCGNAARCVGAYLAHSEKRLRGPVTVETEAGPILVTVLPAMGADGANFVCVEMPKVVTKSYKRRAHTILFQKSQLQFDVVNSGVPHVVFNLSQIKSLKSLSHLMSDVDNLGKIVSKTRALTEFKQSGTNVTFYIPGKGNHIESLTFERGVAGYTQACGTGATAAAYSFSKGVHNLVTVRVPGGKLAVDLSGQRPLLIGPAKFIAEIELH